MKNSAEKVLNYIKKSPSPFHAVNEIGNLLEENKFTYLKEGEAWNLKLGHKYYTKRNGSSLIAFTIPKEMKDYHFSLIASHLDSPTYKIKAEAELNGVGEYIKLNVEPYGGMIDYTWLDKPLSIAGRVCIKEKNSIVSKLIYIDKDILLIPSVAIHMNREVNKGYNFNRQVDLCPLFTTGALKKGDFDNMIARELKVNEKDIVSKDLFLVNRQEGKIWGYKDEFISSPKLDDLEASYTSLLGFLTAKENGNINLFVAFDNEEVGSNTKQGAMSTFLKDTLKRINANLNKTNDEYYKAISKSFMISFDNAHSVHPNHPEKTDEENRCFMNKGIVIKENAQQKYTTDAFSRSILMNLCDNANIPYQLFANRSDSLGGSTLGNISNVEVSMHSVDIGLPQLAMHSSYETAGVKDIDYAISLAKEFYSHLILIDEAEKIEIV